MSKPSQATILAELALSSDGLELFATPRYEPYVLIPSGTHHEVWPTRSSVFRRWLSSQYFAKAGTAPGSQAIQDALGVLEGKALFNGGMHEVHLRLAEHDGAIWLDLSDDYWQAVKITAGGWEVVHAPPVRFRRPAGIKPLPYPENGGSLDSLRGFVNVTDTDWPLFLGWLVGALRPRGPYAVLLVYGEQGSAKSTLVRVARSLIDPNEAPARREPKNGEDLIVAARNSLVVAFDNVSRLPLELSDDLARLATGAGFGARQLYTNLEEVIVHVARPITINGIEEVATRGDLLDRGLVLNLPRIQKYQDEDVFWRSFDEAHPGILGALLDAVVVALRNHPHTPAPNIRMADFARWAAAAEPGLGLECGAFAKAYRANRANAIQVVLEAEIITEPVQLIAQAGFEGTATALLDRLTELVGETVAKRKAWPKAPHVLSGKLRRIAPPLRRLGIEVEFIQDRSTRTISITKPEQEGEQASQASRSVTDDVSDDACDARDASSPTYSKEPVT